MATPYAEVIGDPIAQSKSPLIYKHWLEATGASGDYRAVRVTPTELSAYFSTRRADPDWRGCNVTMPLKHDVISFLDHVDPGADAIGAVNCIVRGPDGLTGRNTDVDGIAAALAGLELAGAKATVIGAGGAARAALHYLRGQGVGLIALVVRDPLKAAGFRSAEGPTRVEISPLGRAHRAFQDARLVVNASPLGMGGKDPMPRELLDAVAAHAPGAALFDMVYRPLKTEFLAAGQANGAATIDGLTMLIGQARAAFTAYFGQPAPRDDSRLRALLSA
ncbi:shikimate dehydrogenase [Sphingosinicella sp. LY1275]|uniref:shikimate dehydrogenase family protein n=1 Tax=Sphingosinicella sp. LY1275 TaxID=3095379 RepID=UPI002ADEDF72|nr:shikimate dehydrogenase [Sphingosinicella sp. LY1275]MEA1015526.1 shikimate dehydrogenase [Sphingosinicella sp. LY1275]